MAQSKEEKAAVRKLRYIKNKEDILAKSKAYHLKNKEKRNAQVKAWFIKNKERAAAVSKVWRDANPEKIAAKGRAWSISNPEKKAAAKQKHLLKLNLANKHISGRTLHAWAQQVKKRDTACLYCGSTSKLHAHHILSKSKHPDHALFLNNGITLCEVCHIQEHILNGDI